MGRRTAKRHSRGLGAAGALLFVVAGAGVVWPGPEVSAQTEARSLVAAASAQGVRITYTVPDLFVVTEFIDGGGPVAQATVDSTGRAISFASLPYPGENAVTASGLASFATGLPVPNYPFYARADHPVQPSSEVKDPSGSYAMVATAEQGKAVGSADFGFGGAEAPVSGSSADASGVIETDGATVEAVSVSKAIDVAESTLKIASVTSRSVTTYRAGMDKPETKTELLIEGAKVGEQAVTIGPDGVHPGDQTVPVPIGQGSQSLNEALAQAGITVKTIAGDELEGGGAGDALEITVKHPIPGAENVQGTLVYQLGGATSYVAIGEGVPFLPPIEDVPVPAEASSPAPSGTDTRTPPAATGSGLDAVPSLPPGVAGEPLPLTIDNGSLSLATGPVDGSAYAGGSGAIPGAGATVAAPVTGTAEPVVLARDFSDTTKALFAILGVAGALLVSSSALWRFFGVSA
ncbi:MAG: hypothetical protein ACRDZ3_23630 [Acidimicrobiia bacterium]